jgi:hypothetical protein
MFNSPDFATVTIAGKECTFTRLERHVLYCVEDGKTASYRYSDIEVHDTIVLLSNWGYLDDNTNLTEKGTEAIRLLKARTR